MIASAPVGEAGLRRMPGGGPCVIPASCLRGNDTGDCAGNRFWLSR
jgi:hypothetical protein